MSEQTKSIDWQRLTAGQTDASQLEEIRREWPYFVWGDLVALEQGLADADQAQALRARIALATGDTEALARVLDDDTDFADFYPDMQPVRLTTNDTIDAFLNRFGTDQDKETDLLTRMIFTLASDDVVAQHGAPAPATEQPAEAAPSETPDPTASRIDAFLASSRQPARTPEALRHLDDESTPEAPASTTANAGTHGPCVRTDKTEPSPSQPAASQPVTPTSAKPAPSSSLSLSLARMMIKNRNYAKALEILNKLDLQDKEKSIIFADQIRFLRKLIIIQEHQNR